MGQVALSHLLPRGRSSDVSRRDGTPGGQPGRGRVFSGTQGADSL